MSKRTTLKRYFSSLPSEISLFSWNFQMKEVFTELDGGEGI